MAIDQQQQQQNQQQQQKDTASTGRRFWPQFQLPTAASLQHRFYKYLLSKLTLLSNADLDQAEHPDSISSSSGGGGGGGTGGFGHIVLRNVELDSDKLSSYLAAPGGALPGAYVRHGGLARLELELLAAGAGGTRVVGDGVKLTVALTRAAAAAAAAYSADADRGGLDGLLERTTADLAESIIMPAATGGLPGAFSPAAAGPPPSSSDTPEYDLTDSESSLNISNSSSSSSDSSGSARQDGVGYGLGDFSGVVNRVVDAAVSRLNVVLRDVRVRVIIIGGGGSSSISGSDAEDVELELVIQDIRFRTAPDDGTRRVTVSGVECVVKSRTVGSLVGPSANNNNMTSTFGGPSSVTNNNNNNNKFNSIISSDPNTQSSIEDHSVIASRMFQSVLPDAYFQNPGHSFYHSVHSDDESGSDPDFAFGNNNNNHSSGMNAGFSSMMESMVISPPADSDDDRDDESQSVSAAAKSIYMSAMAASESVDPTTTAQQQNPRLFWLDHAELSFRGLGLEALEISAGCARVSTVAWPDVGVAVLGLLESHLRKQAISSHSSPSATDTATTTSAAAAATFTSNPLQKEKVKPSTPDGAADASQGERARLEKFRLDQLEVSFTKALVADGEFVSDGRYYNNNNNSDSTADDPVDGPGGGDSGICLDLRGIHYSSPHDTTQLFEVGSIALHRGSATGDILVFPDDLAVGSRQSDFICQITTAHLGSKQQQQHQQEQRVCRVMVPNAAKISVNTTDIFILQDVAAQFASVLNLLSTLPTSPASVEPQSSAASSELAVIGQTSSFDIRFTLGDGDGEAAGDTISVTVFPVSLDSNHIAFCPQVVVAFPGGTANPGLGGDANSVVFKKLSFQYGSSANSNGGGGAKTLHIMTGNVQLDVAYLQQLGDQFTKSRAAWESKNRLARGAFSASFNTTSANNYHPLEAEKKKKKHISFRDDQAIKKSVFELKVAYLGLQLGLPGKLSRFDVDLGDLHARLLASGASVLELHTIHVSRDMGDIDPALGHLSLVHKVNDRKTPSNNVNSSSSRSTDLGDSVATIRDSVLAIPVRLVDCVVGLSPLHLPSHACVVISSGSSVVRQSSFTKSIAIALSIDKASLLMVDDRKYLSSMGSDSHKKHGHSSSLALQYLAQGYVSIGIINSIETTVNISVLPDQNGDSDKVEIQLAVTIDNVYLKSCADSTHSLMQLVNDLKPVVEPPPPELKYRTTVPGGTVDVMANVDSEIFCPGNVMRARSDSDQFGGSGNFFAEDADLVDDDVPTNLKFIESYYGGPGVGERGSGSSVSFRGGGGGGSSSSSGLHASYTNTDLLLEEDLSVMVARNNLDHSHPAADEVVDFNGSKSVTSFEQRVQLHDSGLNFEENHFGKPRTATHKSRAPPPRVAKRRVLSPTSFSDGESDDELDGRSVSDAGETAGLLLPSYVQAHEPAPDKPGFVSSTDDHARTPPVSIDFCVNNFTWDMHDGYDWKYTRDAITQAISRVEYEAKEIRRFQTEEEAAYNQAVRQEIHSDGEDADLNEDEEGEDLVADVLFNSIYISMSTHQDANDLRKRINKDINDDTASETASVASSISSSRASTPFRPSPSLAKELRQNRLKSLKLKRSKQHKVKIHLTGIHGNMSLFASLNDELPAVEGDPLAHLLNRLDVRVTDAEILDNVATSTWNKFLTYMRSEGDREEGASMFHIIMENVKPVADLATAEIVLNVFVLPLRLHVDQDTLDFITRFFEFQDDRFDSLMAGLQDEIPFIQKADIRAIKVKLDYKPKKIDYAGLRSGHTTEFMNFFILDEAEMVLNHVKLYGVAGFPRLGVMLNGIWMPDIRTNQLGDVLAGLAPVRSIVRLGSGLRDLVVVPVREYRKDGRVIRSLQKGAWQFARNTTSELVKFGAKLAAGTQTFLEQAEQAMGGVGAAGRQPAAAAEIYAVVSDDDDDSDVENYTEASARVRFDAAATKEEPAAGGTKEAVSLYANQPLTLKQGIFSAYDSLGHNLGLAKTAVAGIKSDAVASGSAGGTAKAIMRATPIALIRPMIGATEAVSRTLLGATNQMDPNQARDVEEKYKHAAAPAKK